MVAGEVEGIHVQVFHQQVALLQNLVRGAHLEPSGQHVLPQGSALGGGKGHGGQVPWLHGVYHLGGRQNVLPPVAPLSPGPSHAQDDGDP